VIRGAMCLVCLPLAAVAQDIPTVEAAAVPFFEPGTFGEPFADTGLAQGCLAEGAALVCTITSRGVNLIVQGDLSGADALALLQDLPVNTPVAFSGDILGLGDITAEFALSTLEIGDPDPYAQLRADLQGDWVSVDDPDYALTFDGTQRIDSYGGEVQGVYLTSLQDQCPEVGGRDPDGPDGTGPVLLAELMGGDPMTDLYCYAVLAADGLALEMSLIGGNGTTLSFVRP
jgi:hypothetical protein